MQIHQREDGLLFSLMNEWETGALRALPAAADFSRSKTAEARLLPRPAVEADLDPELAMDWVEYTVPDLREHFASAVAAVSLDLSLLSPEPVDGDRETPEPLWSMPIPSAHIEAWYMVMNQARLVMSATDGIDAENEPDLQALLNGGKLEKWFQSQFYAGLQAWMVERVMEV